MPETIAIIGAGPLGRWLALSAARAGFCVLLEDVMPTNLRHAQETLRLQLGPLQFLEEPAAVEGKDFKAKGTDFSPHREEPAKLQGVGWDGFQPFDLSAQASSSGNGSALANSLGLPEALHRIAFVSTIEDAVRQADLAIDCVPDELESKLEILWLLDRMAPPRTVFATPTTRLSIADLANCTYRPEKCVAIAAEASTLAGKPASEVLLRTTTRTAPETISLLKKFWEQLGFIPRFEPSQAE